MAASKIAKALVRIGQHTNDKPSYEFPDYANTTIDIRKMLSTCKTKFTDEELLNFEQHLPELIEDIFQNGGPSDALYDTLHIMTVPDHVPRDNNQIDKRPPLIYTHPKEAQRFSIWKKDHSPEEVTRKKIIEKAQAILAQEEKDATKKAVAVLKAQEDKEFLATLTKEETKIYKDFVAGEKRREKRKGTQKNKRKKKAKSDWARRAVTGEDVGALDVAEEEAENQEEEKKEEEEEQEGENMEE